MQTHSVTAASAPRRQARAVRRDRVRKTEDARLLSQAKFLQERARLVRLVRANGFPSCSAKARVRGMRKYLQERGIKF